MSVKRGKCRTLHSLQVVLQRNEVLGKGAYGEVCRCILGHLPCAGKVLHEALYRWQAPGSAQMFAKFEEECLFISDLKHPNIVQYLGLHYDPETEAPVLLMELLDCNLTVHLSRQSFQPLPPKQQLDLCLDVSLALEFLHAHEILHLDLSSNNVLLQLSPFGALIRAKLTDFWVSKISDTNRFLAGTNPCPGSLVFMPPEALCSIPEYSSKLDIFSFGVLMVQIITTRFPDPVPYSDVQLIETELERRAQDLDTISSDHPIKPLAIECLSNDRSSRPSSARLCIQLNLIKNTDFYSKDYVPVNPAAINSFTTPEMLSDAASTKISSFSYTQCSLCNQFSQERDHYISVIEELQEKLTIESDYKKDYQKNYDNLTQQLLELLEQNSLLREKNDDLNEQLSHASKIIGNFHTGLEEQADHQGEQEKKLETAFVQITNLEKALKDANDEMNLLRIRSPTKSVPTSTTDKVRQRSASGTNAKQKEKKKEKDDPYKSIFLAFEDFIPLSTSACLGATAANEFKAYFVDRSSHMIFGYNTVQNKWSFDLPPCPVTKCGLVVINNGELLTVGGEMAGGPTNKLYSLDETNESWVTKFPPMKKRRSQPGVTVVGDKHVVAAGGSSLGIWALTFEVEVLNIATNQWQVAASLPVPLCRPTLIVANDQVHAMGGLDSTRKWQKRCFSISVSKLINSSSSDLWKVNSISDLPTSQSAVVAKNDVIFSIGGCIAHNTVSDVYIYNVLQRKWIKMKSPLKVARSQSLVVSLAGKQLIVVVGQDNSTKCQSVEFINVLF